MCRSTGHARGRGRPGRLPHALVPRWGDAAAQSWTSALLTLGSPVTGDLPLPGSQGHTLSHSEQPSSGVGYYPRNTAWDDGSR